MGNDSGNKLEPPKLFGRKKPEQPAKSAKAPHEATAGDGHAADDTQVLEPVAAEPTTAEPDKAPTPARAAKPATKSKPAKKPRDIPVSDGHLAAALVGLVVGLFLAVAVWLCEEISQQTRGTSSLGSAGFPLLVGVFILAVVGGAALLRLAKTPSPGSVSFLGTGLVAVLAMLFLSDHTDSFASAVVVVVVAIAAFLLSRWVTVRYIDAE